ncbi:MAG: hypothetical protein NXI32_27910 [bacterium]|nr:hypothetical protein [bacterium]
MLPIAMLSLSTLTFSTAVLNAEDGKQPKTPAADEAPLELVGSAPELEKEAAKSADEKPADEKSAPKPVSPPASPQQAAKAKEAEPNQKGSTTKPPAQNEASKTPAILTSQPVQKSDAVTADQPSPQAAEESSERTNKVAWSILEATLQLAPNFSESNDNAVAAEEDSKSSRKAPAELESKLEVKSAELDFSPIPDKDQESPPKKLQRIEDSDARPIEEAGKECPGAPDADSPPAEPQPDDIEVEQDDHPYDAPVARHQRESQRPAEVVLPEFSNRELEIHRRINQTLGYYLNHPETVVRRGPWALMHAALPFGVETEVVAGNRRVNAIGWMCYNGVCARQRMFQPTRTGFRTNVGPGVQGHEGQFLAILAQSRVQADYPIKIGSQQFSINDLVRYEMSTCRERSELTFKLIGLSYYLQPEERWRDSRGGQWNIEKLLREELAQPINGAACGGSHRLMAISFALIERQKDGLPLTGIWSKAESYLSDYVAYTMSLQNPDGSFSTEWFEGRGNKPDVERKVQTTGHMLEWLIYTLPDEHLRSPKILASLEFLLNTVGAQPERNWPIGPRGHALRAMALYNQRMFGMKQGEVASFLAQQPGSSVRR